jgi:hypothetical protein
MNGGSANQPKQKQKQNQKPKPKPKPKTKIKNHAQAVEPFGLADPFDRSFTCLCAPKHFGDNCDRDECWRLQQANPLAEQFSNEKWCNGRCEPFS